MKTTALVIFWIFLACAAVFAGFDVYYAVDEVEGNTLSELTAALVEQAPATLAGITFTFGYFAGHLTWPQRKKE